MTWQLHIWLSCAWAVVVISARFYAPEYTWLFWLKYGTMLVVSVFAARALYHYDKAFEQMKEVLFGKVKQND
jgi:hypothetical protein